MKSEHIIFIPDIHFRAKAGGEDRRTLDAFKKYLNDNKPWDRVIFAGDVMDHAVISDKNKGQLRSVAAETINKDYEHANRQLDEIHQATGPAKYILIEGNHDYRPMRVIDEQPALAGLIETPVGLRLQKRGWLWVPFWSQGDIYNVGKASFGHGRYTNQHHAYKHAQRYGRNFYYGHLHDMQSFTMEREGDDLKYEAASCGCLCEYRQFYLKGRPTKWQQGFSTFHFRPDGFYNRYETRIFNHRFTCPNGKEYKG